MKNLLIKINELKVNNYSRRDDSFDVIVSYIVNNQPGSITKHFKMEKRTEVLGHELVEFLKKYIKDKNKPAMSESDFLGDVVITRYNDIEEVEEKVSMFFKRFNDHIKGHKTKGFHEGFLTRYSTPDGFSMKIE